jgi:hypothetical protein
LSTEAVFLPPATKLGLVAEEDEGWRLRFVCFICGPGPDQSHTSSGTLCFQVAPVSDLPLLLSPLTWLPYFKLLLVSFEAKICQLRPNCYSLRLYFVQQNQNWAKFVLFCAGLTSSNPMVMCFHIALLVG